jgi:hypothetical protein
MLLPSNYLIAVGTVHKGKTAERCHRDIVLCQILLKIGTVPARSNTVQRVDMRLQISMALRLIKSVE